MQQQICYQKNIMIVNNNPDIVNDLQELFKSHGFQVTIADNSRKCLLELEKGFQGIIILGHNLPRMDGIATIRKIWTEGFINQNTIIMLTSERIQGEEFDEIYPYIYDIIIKPYDNNAVFNIIKKITKQSSL
jgi:DNA-binding NtrC family response regulator